MRKATAVLKIPIPDSLTHCRLALEGELIALSAELETWWKSARAISMVRNS